MSDCARFDVVIVGAGPAGLAAAATSAETGARVLLVDDNPSAGGQIWRADLGKWPHPDARPWITRLPRQVERLHSARVVDADPLSRTLLIEAPANSSEIHWNSLVLATGARELFLPFPGWTLPGVLGAGGLQALAKSGLDVTGKRIVVAGTGPLLLSVAASLRQRGAHIPCIVEQAPWARLARFAFRSSTLDGKALQALQLAWSLRGVRYRAGAWVSAVEGQDRVSAVRLESSGQSQTIPCDYLATGYGLVPNTELAQRLGCRLDAGFVAVTEEMGTTVPSVFAAGELTGIGGVDAALAEGQVAGHAAVGRAREARALSRTVARWRALARALDETFALRDELRRLPHADTVVCRCEDVRWRDLSAMHSWREAKLHSRCGMGPCQARVCGAALGVLKGWDSSSVRPPILPARAGTLATLSD